MGLLERRAYLKWDLLERGGGAIREGGLFDIGLNRKKGLLERRGY